MGYDIESVDSNPAQAEAFAKRYEYNYMFETDGSYKGAATVYFRANIWGMGIIRNVIVEIAERNRGQWPMALLEACSINDGLVVSPDQIKDFLDQVTSYTGLNPDDYETKQSMLNEVREAIKPIVTDVMIKRNEQIKEPIERHEIINGKLISSAYTLEDQVNDNTNLVVEFIDYCDTCLSLNGFQVF
jgi:hypothetical protein